MEYRIFYTDKPLPTGQTEPDYSRILPVGYATKEIAIERAFKYMEVGAIVWKIDGPGGFLMSREEIEEMRWLKMGKRVVSKK